MIAIYAPQALSKKRMLWGYLHDVISRWSGEVIVMGDFNEVRMTLERNGSNFHKLGADAFNHFITSSGLNDIPLGGYTFTWVHKEANKMSKLDQILVSDSVLATFPSLTRKEWKEDKVDERNSMIYLKKKLQLLKKKLRAWGKDARKSLKKKRFEIQSEIRELDKQIDSGDKNSRYFHGVINKRRHQRSIRSVLVNGEWIENPDRVKREFHDHFASCFSNSHATRLLFEGLFPRSLSNEQAESLEAVVTDQEIKNAVWDCGLHINVHKCSLMGVGGVTNDEVTRVASLIGCEAAKTPFKYLGVVVSRSCSRLTLIKSVPGSLPTYYFSLFKVPSSVLKKLESLRSCFFRGANDRDKKMAWVSWDKVLANKKNRGLGVNSFFAMNRALLFKWVWRFKIQKEVLWVKVVKSIHGNYGGIANLGGINRSLTWLECLKSVDQLKKKRVNLMSFVHKEVGDGKDTLFWLDPWLEDGPFKCKFPRVYALEDNKHVSVGDKLNMGISASLRRFPRGGAENSQMNNLRHLVNEVVLSGKSDT
ncbi:RNA-directed DNA polymerase, eukaryota [Tanacetum coccineum]